jgi:hypothetical protein
VVVGKSFLSDLSLPLGNAGGFDVGTVVGVSLDSKRAALASSIICLVSSEICC